MSFFIQHNWDYNSLEWVIFTEYELFKFEIAICTTLLIQKGETEISFSFNQLGIAIFQKSSQENVKIVG